MAVDLPPARYCTKGAQGAGGCGEEDGGRQAKERRQGHYRQHGYRCIIITTGARAALSISTIVLRLSVFPPLTGLPKFKGTAN